MTRVAATAAVLACAGCELVFPISGPTPDARPPGDGDIRPDADPNDFDGDTIPDGVDNCDFVANVLQENEDNDPRGDACDECPFVGETTPTDTDQDGVGDLCDPHPLVSGDAIVLFDGFASDTAAWQRFAGTWELVVIPGGAIQELGTGGSARRLLWTGSAQTFDEIYAQARFVVDDVGSSGFAGIHLDFIGDQPGERGIVCGLFVDAVITRGLFDAESAATLDDEISGAAGTTYVYRASAVGKERRCDAGPGAMPTASLGTDSADGPHLGRIGLFATDVRITAEWFVIYTFVAP